MDSVTSMIIQVIVQLPVPKIKEPVNRVLNVSVIRSIMPSILPEASAFSLPLPRLVSFSSIGKPHLEKICFESRSVSTYGIARA